MANRSFTAQYRRFAEKAQARTLAVFRLAAQEVAHAANRTESEGGRIPVDTGFLRASMAGSSQGMPEGPTAGTPGAQYERPVGKPVELATLEVQMGGSVWIGWTAAYARRMEYGFVGEDSLGREYMQPGKAFLRGAVQNWQQIVDDAAREVVRRGDVRG